MERDPAEVQGLVAENPDLDVLPLVDEDASSGDYAWSLGYFGRATVDEYVFGCDHTDVGLDDERIYLRSEDEEDLFDRIADRNENASKPDSEIDAIIAGLAWKEAIFIRITGQ